MKQYLIINPSTGAILADYETLIVAQESADKDHPHPNHVLDTGAAVWDISGPDLVRLFNALPGVEKTQRFSSKDAGQKRVLGTGIKLKLSKKSVAIGGTAIRFNASV